MKIHKNKIWWIFMLAAMIANTLTGCLELRPAEPDAKYDESVLWKQAYENVIRQTYAACDTAKPNTYKNYGRYGLYDFDQDDIPELFLEVYGTSIPDGVIHVYDFVGNELIQLDDIESGHAWIYGVDEPNAVLYGYSGTGGVQGWMILRYENGEFHPEMLAEYYPAGYIGIEPQEDPLPGMGYTVSDIESWDLSDLSGLNLSLNKRNIIVNNDSSMSKSSAGT